MTNLEINNDLFAPPFCETVETFIAPIPGSRLETSNSFKIAGGWQYFNQLKVIQKYND